MAVEVGWGLVDLFAFFFLVLASNIVFFLSEKMDPKKKVTLSVFVLGFGFNLIGLSHLFKIGFEAQIPIFIPLIQLIGILFMMVGVVTVFWGKGRELMALRKRYEEVSAIISNLEKKYYEQKISREELKDIYASLLKELAELEVKMKKNKI